MWKVIEELELVESCQQAGKPIKISFGRMVMLCVRYVTHHKITAFLWIAVQVLFHLSTH